VSRELRPPAALAGIDWAAHRDRAKRALALFIGGKNLKASPAHWEAGAEALLVSLERYGIAPLWVFDPEIERRSSSAAAARAALDRLCLPPLSEADKERLAELMALPGGMIVPIDESGPRWQSAASAYFFPDDVVGCA
jgi:hypothetical protein